MINIEYFIWLVAHEAKYHGFANRKHSGNISVIYFGFEPQHSPVSTGNVSGVESKAVSHLFCTFADSPGMFSGFGRSILECDSKYL